MAQKVRWIKHKIVIVEIIFFLLVFPEQIKKKNWLYGER